MFPHLFHKLHVADLLVFENHPHDSGVDDLDLLHISSAPPLAVVVVGPLLAESIVQVEFVVVGQVCAIVLAEERKQTGTGNKLVRRVAAMRVS